MITATASALQGYDAAPKGIIIAIHALAMGAVSFIACDNLWVALVVTLLSVAWWFVLRGGKQAQVELRCMDWHRDNPASYMDVLKAHYYTGWMTILGLYLFNYGTRWGIKLGWENQWHKQGQIHGKPIVWNHGRMMNKPFWDCRRPTEFLTGLTFDLMVAAFTFLMIR